MIMLIVELVLIVDYLVCEKYNCTNALDTSLCYHGYEECNSDGANHFCQSTYYINGDNKLDLLQKGCLDSELPGYNCSTNEYCHIDNPLNGSGLTIYACCCHTSLCNQNESFTHPTELDIYGENNYICMYVCRYMYVQSIYVCMYNVFMYTILIQVSQQSIYEISREH